MGDILSKSSLIKDIELVVKDTHTNEKNNEVGKEKLKERTKTVLDEDFDHTDNKCVYNGRPNATAPAIEKTNFIPPSTGDQDAPESTKESLAYNVLTILTIIVLLLGTTFGIWAVVHPQWIMTHAKANLPAIKIPMTKKSIGNQMSMKLDMALYKACLDLNVTVQALHSSKQGVIKKESEIKIRVQDCYDKDNLPDGVELMKMFKMMMDFVFVLVGLMVGAVHAFVAVVLLLWKFKRECCCCTHYFTIIMNGVLSAACSLFGVIIANKKLTSEGKFFYDMIDLATKTKGDAAALMASVKAPLLSAFRKNSQRGGAFDVAMASAVFCTLGFVLLVILALFKRKNDKKKGDIKSYLV